MALPAERDEAGQPIWRGGASLNRELSLPKLQARWDTEGTEPRRTTRLSADERVQLWGEARQAVDDATRALRRLAGDDPAAADVLNVTCSGRRAHRQGSTARRSPGLRPSQP